jgi:hypothetical protein
MCKKLIFLVSLVFVLGSAWTSPAEAAIPDLVGWWKFDEGSGTIAADSSGHDIHGVLGNAPVWHEDGVYNGCLFFDGDRAHVRIAHQDSLNPADGSFTVTFWSYMDPARGTRGSTEWDLAVAKRDTGSAGYYIGALRTRGSADQAGFKFMLGDTAASRKDTPYLLVPLGEWVFVTCVLDRDQNVHKISVDGGQTWASATPPSGPIAPAEDLGIAWDIGINNYWFHGRIDDVAIFSRALTPDEALAVYTFGPIASYPTKAGKPNPDDEATDVSQDVVLSWDPGYFAPATDGHTVYLSESFNDVNDGIGGITHSASSYAPGRLEFETTYYWRVDEVNAPPDSTVYAGKVWSFTTEPLAYPIAGANITATASSSNTTEEGPENTINGSGLDVNDLHSSENTAMWFSAEEKDPNRAWIEYELDEVYKLHEMLVWNSNQPVESMIGFGIKDAAVEYSVDGNDWTALVDVPEFSQAPGADGYAANTTVDFAGAAAKYVKITANSNWGGALDQFGLSEVRLSSLPVLPKELDPASGTSDMDVDNVTLGWRAGREAASHEVHLSTEEQDVIDSNALVATGSETSYDTGELELGTTYYWKVNEVNDAETPTTWQGDISNFSTQESLVVETFENYNDISPDRIFETWIDGIGHTGHRGNGSGAIVGYIRPPHAEQSIVHGDKQSMPFFYDNYCAAGYSEATANVGNLNWTKHGIKTLSLWFFGDPSNAAEQMYVKVNGSKVLYDGEAANLTLARWQPWNIELADFDVDPGNVTELGIGFERSGETGGSGMVYFDDFRLYAYSRQLITPVEPDTANLVGHWKFDGDTLDDSGLGNHGTANGDPTYAVGQVGQAISLDGTGDYVTIDGVTDDITSEDITLAGWVKTANTGSVYWFSCNGPGNENVALFAILGGRAAIYDGGAEGHSSTLVNDLDWHHLAYSRSGSTGYIYVDGSLENTHTANYTFTDPLNRWSIGQEWDGTNASNFLTGMVDDARIYDSTLSYAEVAWLAGRILPFDKAF